MVISNLQTDIFKQLEDLDVDGCLLDECLLHIVRNWQLVIGGVFFGCGGLSRFLLRLRLCGLGGFGAYAEGGR